MPDPEPNEQPCFLDELPPGAPLPDRVNLCRSRSYELLPGETDAQARKRLQDSESYVEALWLDESQRRLAALDAGDVVAVDAADVHARLREIVRS